MPRKKTVQQISAFQFDLKSRVISWKNGTTEIKMSNQNCSHALVDSKGTIVVLLIKNEGADKSELIGFDSIGQQNFKSFPPRGYRFSHLTLHPKAQIAVVCGGEEEVDGWYDWHFSIQPETGELKRIYPAY
ncbi:MAG: hypothetical protein ABIY63_18180 [Fibrobacteria bacterium]